MRRSSYLPCPMVSCPMCSMVPCMHSPCAVCCECFVLHLSLPCPVCRMDPCVQGACAMCRKTTAVNRCTRLPHTPNYIAVNVSSSICPSHVPCVAWIHVSKVHVLCAVKRLLSSSAPDSLTPPITLIWSVSQIRGLLLLARAAVAVRKSSVHAQLEVGLTSTTAVFHSRGVDLGKSADGQSELNHQLQWIEL